MDAVRLEYFLTVAESRTLSEAADRLRLTQPSLSAALRTFERECGMTLFDRRGRRLILNDAGRRLVPYAREARSALRNAGTCVQELRGLTRGEVVVAATPLISAEVCRLIADFRRARSGVSISLVPMENSEQVVAAVMGGEAELGVVHGPWAGEGRGSVPIEQGESILLVRTDDPLAGRESVGLADLGARDLITSAPESYSGQVLRDARDAGVELRPAVHCPHRSAVPSMVKSGVGIAVVGRALYNPDDPHLVAISFTPRRTFPTSLIFRDGPSTPATRAFVESARSRSAARGTPHTDGGPGRAAGSAHLQNANR